MIIPKQIPKIAIVLPLKLRSLISPKASIPKTIAQALVKYRGKMPNIKLATASFDIGLFSIVKHPYWPFGTDQSIASRRDTFSFLLMPIYSVAGGTTYCQL